MHSHLYVTKVQETQGGSASCVVNDANVIEHGLIVALAGVAVSMMCLMVDRRSDQTKHKHIPHLPVLH